MRSLLLALPCVVWSMLLASVAPADDWPQWMGPRRDAIWREAGLAGASPAAGLPVKWRVAVQGG